MSTLLEKVLEQVVTLPRNEQDAIAAQILLSLADEDAWKKQFAAKRDVIGRMASEALEEDEKGETHLPDDLLMQSRTTRQFWRRFSDLPDRVQSAARNAYRLFQSNPAHPGLQFKKLDRLVRNRTASVADYR